jgi:mRNA interferase MazF
VATSWAPERGDLVWLRFHPQSGHEQAGRRPALVVSPRAYNEKVGLALFCPIASRAKEYPFEVALPAAGEVTGVVLTDQIKSLDWRARKADRMGKVNPDIIDQTTARILPLVEGA